jgi:hypothetical protein
MWDNSISVGVPSAAGILFAIGVLVMTINPTVQQLKAGRNILVVAIALLTIIPIYSASGPNAPFPDWVIMASIWAAVIALLEYIVLFVSSMIIENATKKDR